MKQARKLNMQITGKDFETTDKWPESISNRKTEQYTQVNEQYP